MIWTFGESYARYYRYQPDTWVNKVGTTLDQKVMSFARPLSRLEHCYFKFNRNKDKFTKNDIIILSFPPRIPIGLYRTNNPYKFYLEVNDAEKKAFQYTASHLDYFKRIDEIYVTNFLHNVEYWTKKLELHTIALLNFADISEIVRPIQSRFPSLQFPFGTLEDVNQNEWTKEILATKDLMWREQHDIRVNHLTKSNHDVLVNKVVDNIKNKVPLNFLSGFHRHIVDEEILSNPDFIRDELFNGLYI